MSSDNLIHGILKSNVESTLPNFLFAILSLARKTQIPIRLKQCFKYLLSFFLFTFSFFVLFQLLNTCNYILEKEGQYFSIFRKTFSFITLKVHIQVHYQHFPKTGYNHLKERKHDVFNQKRCYFLINQSLL
jgi:hypothetical protein